MEHRKEWSTFLTKAKTPGRFLVRNKCKKRKKEEKKEKDKL